VPGSGLIRILLIDDNILFRELLAEMLNAELGLCVVGHAASIDLLTDVKLPEIVILDAATPTQIVAQLSRINEISPTSRVLILTMHDDAWLVRTILSSEIGGYLPKTTNKAQLVSALKSIADREPRCVLIIRPDTLLQVFCLGEQQMRGVSSREREILILVAEGLSNAQIGRRLSITEGTVKRHLGNIYTKLGAASRVEAVNRAMTASLIPSYIPRTLLAGRV